MLFFAAGNPVVTVRITAAADQCDGTMLTAASAPGEAVAGRVKVTVWNVFQCQTEADRLPRGRAREAGRTSAGTKKGGRAYSTLHGQLQHAQRAVFSLREVQELDTPDIRKILNISISKLGVLMHRARTHLRECL